MNHIHQQKIPRAALLGAAVLILATVGLAAQSRASRLAEHPVVVAPLESTEIRFEDRKDGTLAVLDAATGREVTTVAPGSNGFVRGVMRGMFRSRKLESMGHDGVFVLSREADGHLILVDPQTKRRVDIASFGPTNASAFDKILVASRTPSRTPGETVSQMTQATP